MEASSAGKREYGGRGRWVKYWARLGWWISPCYGPFSLGAHFETYEPSISLIFTFFSGPRITETADSESVDTGARLYSKFRSFFKYIKFFVIKNGDIKLLKYCKK
jgi:hypothetical protein